MPKLQQESGTDAIIEAEQAKAPPVRKRGRKPTVSNPPQADEEGTGASQELEQDEPPAKKQRKPKPKPKPKAKVTPKATATATTTKAKAVEASEDEPT